MTEKETRIALIGIILTSHESVEQLNGLLSEYGEYIIGRMGLPYREKEISIISVAMDAPNDIISALFIGASATRSFFSFGNKNISVQAFAVEIVAPRIGKHATQGARARFQKTHDRFLSVVLPDRIFARGARPKPRAP